MHQISVICIDCPSDYIDTTLLAQTYANLEVVKTQTGKDFYEDIIQYLNQTDSEYICFLEPNMNLSKDKIKKMADYLENTTANIILCYRNYMEEDGTIASHYDALYKDLLCNKNFLGTKLLQMCFKSERNLFGNLTTVMFKKSKITLALENLKQFDLDDMPELQKIFLLFELLVNQSIVYYPKELVSTYVEDFDLEKLQSITHNFQKKLQTFFEIHEWDCPENMPLGITAEHKRLLVNPPVSNLNIKKEITFFYTDKGEYYNLLPIMREAQKRGFHTNCTNIINAKAEIGVYCQHFGRPENSKFSLVLLHDMVQGHNRWPDIWNLERWNIYDIGIVPGTHWKDRWERSAFKYYANPRLGAFMLGYPKSSEIFSEELEKRAQELKASMNLKYDVSILYAPSWENDEKEDDFVRALASLPVNLFIKQAQWPEAYSFVIENIKNMRHMHEGHYDNLHYIEPEESIMVALKMCDLIISDESSVMIEGLMFEKPSIAVYDWLIPDTQPSRFASIPFDNVYKCKKVELREQVEIMLADNFKKAKKMTKNAMDTLFSNPENVNSDILDAIEYFTQGEGNNDFIKWKMSSRYMPENMWS